MPPVVHAANRVISWSAVVFVCAKEMERGQGKNRNVFVGGPVYFLYNYSMLNYFSFLLTVKTCPRLSVPYYGLVTCKNTDLNLFYDYTPRNESFMEFYDNDDMRITEPMPIDTDCTFRCGPGFYMVGSTTRNCLPLSKWDGLQTSCKRMCLCIFSFMKYTIQFLNSL